MPHTSYFSKLNNVKQTLFIADLHLSDTRPDITACLVNFLQGLTSEDTDSLYILGDLFEVWIGDDDINDFTNQIANALSTVSAMGINILFIHGNRDFLIRNKFARRAGLTLLPEQAVINLYGEDVVILHGDELCTRDIEYQKFRKKARGWWWPNIVLMLPLSLRKHIARKGREISKNNQTQLSEDIMDVTPEEVTKCMQRHDVNVMIHGHTHRPAIHELAVSGNPAKRIVLGDWYDQGSVLTVTKDSKTLKQLPFSGN